MCCYFPPLSAKWFSAATIDQEESIEGNWRKGAALGDQRMVCAKQQDLTSN